MLSTSEKMDIKTAIETLQAIELAMGNNRPIVGNDQTVDKVVQIYCANQLTRAVRSIPIS